jgi:hypothetical protein
MKIGRKGERRTLLEKMVRSEAEKRRKRIPNKRSGKRKQQTNEKQSRDSMKIKEIAARINQSGEDIDAEEDRQLHTKINQNNTARA